MFDFIKCRTMGSRWE